jgi:hypothetical protein
VTSVTDTRALLDDTLRDSQITRAHPLVHPPDPFFTQDVLGHRPSRDQLTRYRARSWYNWIGRFEG